MTTYYVETGGRQATVEAESHKDAALQVLRQWADDGGAMGILTIVSHRRFQCGADRMDGDALLILTTNVLEELGYDCSAAKI